MLKLAKTLSSPNWYASGFIGCRRIRRSTGTKDKNKAERELARIYYEELHSENNPDNILVDDIVDFYLRDNTSLSRDTLCRCQRYKKVLGGYYAHQLDARLINRYVELAHKHKKKRQASQANTIQRDLKGLKAVLKYAVDHSYIPTVYLPKIEHVDDRRLRWLEEHEREYYLTECQPEYRLFFATLFLSGCRLSELRRARDTDVTPVGIIYRHFKGRPRKERARTVPLHPRIQGLSQRQGKLFDFSYQEIRTEHLRICEALGLKDFRIHDIRHTFGTLAARKNGADVLKLAYLMGHENLETCKRYVHLAAHNCDELVKSL